MAADSDPGTTRFKRLNFFKGLVTSEQDWIDREDYRIEKVRFHSRWVHGPGVVRGSLSGLTVAARGDLSVEVQPGAAIDGRGNQIILWETHVKSFPVDSKNDQLLFLVIRYAEQPTDFIAYKHNLAIRGHRRMQEICEIDVVAKEPKIDDAVELCRVLVEKNAKYIRDPKDPTNPKPNEIDTRGVPHAGVAGSHFDANVRRATDKMFLTLRAALRSLARGRVMSAHDSLAALLQAHMLHNAGLLDRRNVSGVMWLVVEQMAFVYDDIVTNHTDLATAKEKELLEYFKQVKQLQPLVWKAGVSDAELKNFYLNLQRAGDLLSPLASGLGNMQTMIKQSPVTPSRRY
jgi:hypothetical protein